jgi:hypothetical protein
MNVKSCATEEKSGQLRIMIQKLLSEEPNTEKTALRENANARNKKI